MGDYGAGRKNQYFLPGDGIAREVITADICKYLDNDATVRPMNYQGRDGFMLYAYRNLTSAMIEDLKKDTLLWEKEQRDKRSRQTSHRNPGPSIAHQPRKRGYEPSPDVDGLAYVDSRTHQRRQDIGPTVPETPSPGIADSYPPGRGPPAGYRQHPSPQHEPSYPPQRGSGGYPGASASPPFQPEYPTAMDTSMDTPMNTGYPGRPSNEYGGYPGSFGSRQPPVTNARGFPPQPPQTAPPVTARDPRDPRYDYPDPRDQRPDPRAMPRGDPRQFPPARNMDYGARQPVDPRAGFDPRGDPRGYQDSRGYRR